MALRVVVASAVVSRKVGRGRNRLGAFSLPAYPRDRAPPARPRQRDHLRRRAPLLGTDAARSAVRGRVRPLEGRCRTPRRRLRRGCALRWHPGRACRLAVRPEARRGRRADPALRLELRVRRCRQRDRARGRAVRPGGREHRDLGRSPRVDLRHRPARATRRGDRCGVRRGDLRRRPRSGVRRCRRARQYRCGIHDHRYGDARIRRVGLARPHSGASRVLRWPGSGVRCATSDSWEAYG